MFHHEIKYALLSVSALGHNTIRSKHTEFVGNQTGVTAM